MLNRDLLLDITPKDIDFSTTATTDQMLKMLSAEKVRMEGGVAFHFGTLKVFVDEEKFEITSLKTEIPPDDCYINLDFSDHWMTDASQRDLTINSMFLDFNGNVYDYFCGYDDLQNGRIAFVGNPKNRAQQNPNHLIRYFRSVE